MAEKQSKLIEDKYIKIDIRKLEQAFETLRRIDRFHSEVGIFDQEVIPYAVHQEYGGPNQWGGYTPPRSFIRATVTEHGERLSKEMGNKLAKLYFQRGGVSAPTFKKIEDVFHEFSKVLELLMVDRIWKHIPPPLSDIRLKQKKAADYPFADTPLVATGRLISSITYRIVRTNPSNKQSHTVVYKGSSGKKTAVQVKSNVPNKPSVVYSREGLKRAKAYKQSVKVEMKRKKKK